MIIKVIELVKTENYTHCDETGNIVQPKKYTLCESFLNTEHIVSFREVDPSFYKEGLPDGLSGEQKFTYINLSEMRKGMTVVESPLLLQQKINDEDSSSELLRG